MKIYFVKLDPHFVSIYSSNKRLTPKIIDYMMVRVCVSITLHIVYLIKSLNHMTCGSRTHAPRPLYCGAGSSYLAFTSRARRNKHLSHFVRSNIFFFFLFRFIWHSWHLKCKWGFFLHAWAYPIFCILLLMHIAKEQTLNLITLEAINKWGNDHKASRWPMVACSYKKKMFIFKCHT